MQDNDLISRAAIKSEIERIRASTKTLTGIDFLWMIETFPAVDAAPVVRCRFCRHAYFVDMGNPFCVLAGREFRADWFCASGEANYGGETNADG